MRLFESFKKSTLRSLPYIVFVLAIVTGFLFLYAIDQVFRVRQIIVEHSGKRTQVVGLEAVYYQPTAFLNEEKVAEDLLRVNPYARNVLVKKELPQRIYVTIEWQSPFVQIQTKEGVYLLGEDTRILEKRKEKVGKLPIISYYQTLPFSLYQAGRKLDFRDIILSIELLKRMRNLGYTVETIDIVDFSMLRYTSTTKQFLFSAEKDLETQWYQAERLIKELRIKGEDFTRIDVRFEKPIYEPV